MKTKLLKRIRKRYTITYYPKQVNVYSETFKGECMVLVDRHNDYRTVVGVEICSYDKKQSFWEFATPNKQDAKICLLNRLAKWIEADYKKYRTRKTKQKIETIWYNHEITS